MTLMEGLLLPPLWEIFKFPHSPFVIFLYNPVYDFIAFRYIYKKMSIQPHTHMQIYLYRLKSLYIHSQSVLVYFNNVNYHNVNQLKLSFALFF